MDERLEEFLDRCLLLDLETGPDGAVHKIGAVWREETFLRQGRVDTQSALVELEDFAVGADFLLGHNLLGHNLLGHDLPCLQALAPGLRLLHVPVLDTLYLSPLAFPENPYHQLVKDYKLVRDSLSEPSGCSARGPCLCRTVGGARAPCRSGRHGFAETPSLLLRGCGRPGSSDSGPFGYAQRWMRRRR